MNARIQLAHLLRRNIFSIQLSTIVRGVSPKVYLAQKGVTGICIEGYPRSGNTFAVLMFNKVNDVHIAHHTHCTGQVARALRYGIPAVVLIRKPVDAITSSVFALGRRGAIDDEVYRYLAFYRWVESRIDSIVLATFETAISDFNRVIRRVNEKHDTRFNYLKDLDEATAQVKQYLDERFTKGEHSERLRWVPTAIRNRLPGFLFNMAEQREATLRWKPIPVPEREKEKEALRPLVASHEHIGEAQALYARLIDSTSTPADNAP